MEKDGNDLIVGDVDILHAFLHGEPSLTVREDADYGRLFEVEFTACCVTLPVLFWFNSRSRGVFLRVDFPNSGALYDHYQLLNKINYINLTLPVGAFVADLKSCQVRYKNAVFVGELPLHVEILGNLVAGSFEMVRMNYSAIVSAMCGKPHTH